MRLLVAGLLFLSTMSSVSIAQGNRQAREGFWLSFGLGYGSLSCDVCNGSAGGGVAYLRMGGTVSQRLLIGGEVTGWSRTEKGVTLTVSNIGPIFLFYPAQDGGFFLRGGVGIGSVKYEVSNVSLEDTGAGVTLGMGWDARLGKGFALTPFVDLTTVSIGGGSVNSLGFGLGFTWP